MSKCKDATGRRVFGCRFKLDSSSSNLNTALFSFSVQKWPSVMLVFSCIDMISDLPNDVMHNIMQFLPFIDATRMSVLSKKCRSNWLSIPKLVFDDEFVDPLLDNNYDVDACKWSSVISNIVLLHKGPLLNFH